MPHVAAAPEGADPLWTPPSHPGSDCDFFLMRQFFWVIANAAIVALLPPVIRCGFDGSFRFPSVSGSPLQESNARLLSTFLSPQKKSNLSISGNQERK